MVIKHTFIRILAAYLILFLNGLNGFIVKFTVKTSNTTYRLLIQFIFTLTLKPNDSNGIKTSLASSVAASIFHLAKGATSMVYDQ